jgi:ethanolamine utilization cobalamin adenosyltransferase
MPVKQLFGEKGVFLPAIVQAKCFKMSVKILNSRQTIVRQKIACFPMLFYRQFTVNFQKILLVVANDLSNIFFIIFVKCKKSKKKVPIGVEISHQLPVHL